MDAGLIGQIATPASGNVVEPGRVWCADNGVYGGTYPGDEKYLAWLAERAHLAALCRFVVAPDVVCDAQATLARSAPIFARIRALGYPVALAAQNGLEHLAVPWDDIDALFIGGDDPWKEGDAAADLVAEANARGKWTHMGRVNTYGRLRIAATFGCDSVDGTTLAHGPDKNLRYLLAWLRELDHPTLWEVA